MKYTTISQDLFDSTAKKAIEIQPIRKEVSLKNLEVVNDKTIAVEGMHIPMSNQAFKDTIKAVGLPVTFDKSFTGAFGEKARQQLINRLKSSMAAKGQTTVSLVVSPETKSIIGVHKSPKDLISNDSFLKTATQVIDQHGLEVNNFTVNDEGNIFISTSSPKNQWGMQGLKDEDFFGGVSFINNPKDGFQVSPFLYRLVCANGMIGKSFEETMKLTSFDSRAMEGFFNEINAMAKAGFKPEKFEAQVRNAISTNASLFEMEEAYHMMKAYSGADYKELEAWVPLQKTRARYHASGLDTIIMSKEQKKNAKTGTPIWDVINGLTHFSTHDNGFRIDDTDRRRMQVEAGRMLTKEYDMANIVKSPF